MDAGSRSGTSKDRKSGGAPADRKHGEEMPLTWCFFVI